MAKLKRMVAKLTEKLNGGGAEDKSSKSGRWVVIYVWGLGWADLRWARGVSRELLKFRLTQSNSIFILVSILISVSHVNCQRSRSSTLGFVPARPSTHVCTRTLPAPVLASTPALALASAPAPALALAPAIKGEARRFDGNIHEVSP